MTAGTPQPGNAHSFTNLEAKRRVAPSLDPADHLVSGNDVGAPRLDIAFDQMQVGPANTAHLDANPDFVGRRNRLQTFDRSQWARLRRRSPRELHGTHVQRSPAR